MCPSSPAPVAEDSFSEEDESHSSKEETFESESLSNSAAPSKPTTLSKRHSEKLKTLKQMDSSRIDMEKKEIHRKVVEQCHASRNRLITQAHPGDYDEMLNVNCIVYIGLTKSEAPLIAHDDNVDAMIGRKYTFAQQIEYYHKQWLERGDESTSALRRQLTTETQPIGLRKMVESKILSTEGHFHVAFRTGPLWQFQTTGTFHHSSCPRWYHHTARANKYWQALERGDADPVDDEDFRFRNFKSEGAESSMKWQCYQDDVCHLEGNVPKGNYKLTIVNVPYNFNFKNCKHEDKTPFCLQDFSDIVVTY
ncbi:hypothetical protein R1sor_020442 [Riccia sorocarpa]|uniref:Uncharacterized protein n=1 Tax=Riccia sorocarpa TaxID=122646 RepID=A0ABD3IFA8_9MARC